MSDLTAKEQKAVRTVLRFLRLRVGAWAPLAKALRYEVDSVQKVATGPEGGHARARAPHRPIHGRADGRAARRPVALAPGVPALRPPAGGFPRRGDDGRVGKATRIGA